MQFRHLKTTMCPQSQEMGRLPFYAYWLTGSDFAFSGVSVRPLHDSWLMLLRQGGA